MLYKIFIFCVIVFVIYKFISFKCNEKKCQSGIFTSSYLTVKPSRIPDSGKGVYTTKNIPCDTVIERAHGIILKNRDRCGIIQNYDFEIDNKTTLLGFGFASIYNHSPHPNVEYELNPKESCIEFKTTRNIKAGEELYVSYESGANDWFRERGITIHSP